MITTWLEEIVNGWILTTWPNGERYQYERYQDAVEARAGFEMRSLKEKFPSHITGVVYKIEEKWCCDNT